MNIANYIDYIILGIIGFSSLAGLMRGFLKEVIALLTWVAAAFIASFFAGDLAAYWGEAGQQVTTLSLAGSFAAIFVGALIVGSVINYIITRAVEWQGISLINRFLGAGFGLIRGVIMAAVIIFLVQLTPLSSQPTWSQSSMVAAFQPMVQWLDSVVTPGFDNIKSSVNNVVEKANSQLKEATGQ